MRLKSKCIKILKSCIQRWCHLKKHLLLWLYNMANNITIIRTKKENGKFIPKTPNGHPPVSKSSKLTEFKITACAYYYWLALMFVSEFYEERGMHSGHAVHEVGNLSERSIRNVWFFASFPGTCSRASMIKISQLRGRKNENQVSSDQTCPPNGHFTKSYRKMIFLLIHALNWCLQSLRETNLTQTSNKNNCLNC